MIKRLIFVNSWVLFIALAAMYLALVFISEWFIITDEFLIDQLGTMYPVYLIEDMMEVRKKFWWVGYALEPITLSLKLLMLYAVVSIAALLRDIDYSASQIIKAGLIGDSVFFVAKCWFLLEIHLNLGSFNMETVGDLYPLSLLKIWGSEQVVSWLRYPLQTMNLFEVFYVLIVCAVLKKMWKIDFLEIFNLIFPAYLSGLLLLMTFVAFITIQLT